MSAYNAKANPAAFSGYELSKAPATESQLHRLYMRVADWYEDRQVYHRTLRELNDLTDRELADIGIARASIPAVARESAQLHRAERVGVSRS